MFVKTATSLKRINYKLYFSLLFLGLCPTIYTTVRIFFMGQFPGDWAYSIAGQLSWINLLYEILNEAIILPLFFFVGEVVHDRDAFTNRIKTGLLMTFCIYLFFSLVVILFTEPLLKLMAADPSIITESACYIRIESVANIFAILSSFALVTLVTLSKEKYIYMLTFARLILSLISDTLLVSSLPVSLKLGVNGIGYSNIIVNALLLVISLAFLSREGVKVFSRSKISFQWVKQFVKIGGISGLESFVRNLAYMLMISRMVNVVGEQGIYWVVNSFIWGWLLLPVTQLAELIKQEISIDHENVKRNTPGYFAITAIICGIWVITIPFWKLFMSNILGYGDVQKLFNLVIVLLGFYVLYAFQNVFDAVFYGLGKTNYMLFESVATNTVYYGSAFILYLLGIWTPTLTGIALLFGVGIGFDSIVSFVAYRYMLRKEINGRNSRCASLRDIYPAESDPHFTVRL